MPQEWGLINKGIHFNSPILPAVHSLQQLCTDIFLPHTFFPFCELNAREYNFNSIFCNLKI